MPEPPHTKAPTRWIAAVLTYTRLPLVLALVAPLLLIASLGAGWQLDDHFQRFVLAGHGGPSIQLFVFYQGDPATHREGMEAGSEPWWTAETMRHASLRYLSVLTMQLDYLLWPEHPALMHLHNLLWLAALVMAAAFLYRRILGATWAAGLAGLLYALDDAHALPTAYIANRNALIATFLSVLCLLCYDRWRQEAWRAGAVLSPLCLALALSAGEMALATAGYLFAYALFLERTSLGQRISALLPNGAVLAVWAVVYKLGNFGSEGSGFYRDPLGDPLGFAAAFLERAPVLLLGQWTPVPADLGSVFVQGSGEAIALQLGGVGVFVLLLGLLGPLVKRDAAARFWCLGTLLSLLPIAATGPQNRLLFYVGLGSMALLAQVVKGLVSQAPHLPQTRAWRLPAWGLGVGLLFFHLVLAPPMALLTVELHNRSGANMEHALATAPHDPGITAQDLIVVNPPDQIYLVTAIPPFMTLQGLPTARRMRTLATGTTAMTLTRIDAKTLEVELEKGLFSSPFSRYFRGAHIGFAPGQRIELDGFSAEVASLNEAGDPNRVVFRFSVPLEDPSLRWIRWQDRGYVPWQPPAVGESKELPAGVGIFN